MEEYDHIALILKNAKDVTLIGANDTFIKEL